jgi:hypothetical protein
MPSERQLAHVEGNAVRAAYNRGDFWEERVRMMYWWADCLAKWKAEPTPSANRIPQSVASSEPAKTVHLED